MAEFISGPSMVLNWIHPGGTTSLAGDFRSVQWNPTTSYAETSAGSDTQVGRLPTLKDATASIELVNPASGTALYAALQPQVAGTLLIQPEGTAANKRKITFPCYSDGAQYAHPYADVATLTCSFTGAGNIINNFTDGVN